MIKRKRGHVVRCTALSTVLLVGGMGIGCRSKTEPQALRQLRETYAQVQQNPDIATHAPVALREAEEALRRAEQSWENEPDSEEVLHLVYLTKQKVKIARTIAQQKMAEAEMQQLSMEREQVLRNAREREAEQAQHQAMQAQQEAAQAQRDAAQAQQKAEAATARATFLEQELMTLKAKVKETERGLVLTLGDVLFEFQKADIKSGTIRKLDPLVAFLKEQVTDNMVVEGHTDNVGSESFNLNLSQQRAESVREFLVQNGIPAQQVTARGYGEAYPVASNDTEAGRQLNRRVEIILPR